MDRIGTQTGLAVAKPALITNIAQMMEALAVGWDEKSHMNRALITTEDPYNTRRRECQFIQMPENRYNFARMAPGDIPVDSGYYRLRGFIKFEARFHFKELFHLDHADDGDWYRARLTAKGAELARAGLLDFKGPGLQDLPFFYPDLSNIERDKEITMNKLMIGGPA